MTEELHDHDRGLSFDLPKLVDRRRALVLLGGAGVAAIAGCSSGGSKLAATTATTTASTTASTTGSSTSSPATSGSDASTTCSPIPEETGGPYPADGSNGVDVLSESGVVRSDITSSFGSASGVAQGVPLGIALKVLSTAADCAPLVGAAVYLWHCDIAGRYSMYSQGVTEENYLRGVQETDADGMVRFTSIFPAAYSGRWPHIHFEIYPSVADATKASSKLRTSQLALPVEACNAVYATSGYEASVRNLAQTSLTTDMVFRDGYSLQLATVTGSVTDGMEATLTVPV